MSTSTWKYNKGKHSVDEQPAMDKPVMSDYESVYDGKWSSPGAEERYYKLSRIYDEHIASLRSIPVQGVVDWKDGQEVKEDIDYEIYPRGDGWVAISINIQEQPHEIIDLRSKKVHDWWDTFLHRVALKQEPFPVATALSWVDVNTIEFLDWCFKTYGHTLPNKAEWFYKLYKNQSQEQPKPRYVVSGGLRPVDEVGGKGLEIHDQFEQPKQSISETFKQLRELTSGYWDSIKCVCEELGRGKCDANCKEHSENQFEQPKQEAIGSEDEIIDELYAYLKPGEDITCKNSPITTKHLREMFVITRRK